jgi:vacuolar protein sorting-associated protein 35
MRELEDYVSALQKSGQNIAKLYEEVQYCNNVVPRLYLMCCVGGVYIASLEAPAKTILKDLIEMIKGVQHPMRGLFLRSYLSHVTKNRMPDVGSPYEGAGGSVQDAVDFILQNFSETNRLWVRLQTQGTKADKKKREKERQDLRVLVGTNLVRLSQLEGLDVNEYKASVLPQILEQVVSCKDTIAQSYLLDCTIQVFPDEFHLATLEPFLQSFPQLKEKVNVRTILEAMMNRLASYASNNGKIPDEVEAFRMFNSCITSLIEERKSMSVADALKLVTTLTDFSLRCYPSRMEYISHCLAMSTAILDKSDFRAQISSLSSNNERSEDDTTVQIECLLNAPLATLDLRVLELPQYSKLMSFLPWGNWREVASSLLKSILKRSSKLTELEQVEQLFAIVKPLLRDAEGAAPKSQEDDEEEGRKGAPEDEQLRVEQVLVARTVHLMENDDTDILVRILASARNHFTNGGPQRMKHTLPALVVSSLRLARRVQAREKRFAAGEGTAPQVSSRKIFQFIIEVITGLATAHPDVSLKLFLLAAQVSSVPTC